MSIPCLTVIEDMDGREIAVLYRHHDGYPEEHGRELAEFLSGIRIVSELPEKDPPDGLVRVVFKPRDKFMYNGERIAEGMTCLAAQIVAFFKQEAGGFHLFPAGDRVEDESYTYHVSGQPDGEAMIRIIENSSQEVSKELFNGTATELLAWLDSPKESDTSSCHEE